MVSLARWHEEDALALQRCKVLPGDLMDKLVCRQGPCGGMEKWDWRYISNPLAFSLQNRAAANLNEHLDLDGLRWGRRWRAGGEKRGEIEDFYANIDWVWIVQTGDPVKHRAEGFLSWLAVQHAWGYQHQI